MPRGISGIIYGPAKSGKTLSAGLLVLGKEGVFFGKQAAVVPVNTYYNFAPPTVYTPKSVEDCVRALDASLGAGKRRFVVDDLTLMIQEDSAAAGGKPNWPKLVQNVVKIAEIAKKIEDAGGILWVTAHERAPRDYNGKSLRGGPDLPGQLTETFSGMVSIVLRNKYEETSAPYKYQLITGPQKDFISGDRLNVFPNPSPLNLLEGMLLAGFNVPYATELGEWGPKAIEAFSIEFAKDIDNWRNLMVELGAKLPGKDPKHVRFVLVQAMHRAIFRTAGTLDKLLADLIAE